jgi:hypothetical protein
VLTRIATTDFVQGAALPPDTAAYIDVDVYTKEGYSCAAPDDVIAWIEVAHVREKLAFFGLLPANIVEQIREA